MNRYKIENGNEDMLCKENRMKLNMESPCIQLCLGVLVFLASLAIPSDCFDDHNPKDSAALFVFGDSLFDPGNNNYIHTTTDFQANFPPYGESFFEYPTGRFSDGRLISDFIAEYAKLSLIPPYFQTGYRQLANGVNFASGGAGALAETYSGLVINLKMQLRSFKKAKKQLRLDLGKTGAKRLASNAVYLFSIGNNDYLSPFFRNSSVFKLYTPEDYVAMVVGNITAVFKEIYKKGGRKFGILNLGPLGCLPGFRAANVAAGGTGECMEQVNALAKLHNLLLAKELKKLENHLKGFKYSYFDFFAVAVEMFEHPSKFGFKEVKRACCGSGPYRGAYSCGGKREIKEYELCDNPQDYLFFDSLHPSQVANQQLAELMWGGPPNITGPYNLKSLFQLTL